ncbi:MAG: GNAT family N-acetyltransferase [Chloroflexi bacterium]|nr:GNAT family N-acetyltransferase [Chloroflexota bacterium]
MAADLTQIAAFFAAHPQGFANRVDLPYRLASWSLEDPANVRLWESDGELQAVAMLQLPWFTLDYTTVPGVDHLLPEILAWATERMTAIARERNDELPLVVYLTPERAAHLPLVEAHGFQHDADWDIVHLERPLDEPIAPVPLPDGFAVRPMNGQVEAYVDLHQTAFGSKNMRESWRARTLTMSAYRPELDVFIVDPTGRPVAFCIGWLQGDEGQVEPLGVHPDFQRLGLGRAVLLDMLRRFQMHGATRASIHSYKQNDPALALYQRPDNGDFRPQYDVTAYVRNCR